MSVFFPVKFLFAFYNLFFHKEKEFIKKVKILTGVLPLDYKLYKQALSHSSTVKNSKNIAQECNERLEYLGDAVLGLVIAEYLFKKYPIKDEGFLTEMRSKIVNRISLNEIALKLSFDSIIFFDYKTNSSPNPSIYGNALEAFIGALFLDRGLLYTKKFIYKTIILGHLDVAELEKTDNNYKSKLLEFVQKKKISNLSYEVLNEENRGSHKVYTIGVKVGNKVIAQATDTKKKNAEQKASEIALEFLQNQ